MTEVFDWASLFNRVVLGGGADKAQQVITLTEGEQIFKVLIHPRRTPHVEVRFEVSGNRIA